jgi:copper chaperone
MNHIKNSLGVPSNKEVIRKEAIKVEGMTCEHCKQSVETAVLSLPGVMSAMVDLSAEILTVDFDHDKTTLAQLKAAVEAIGFDVV